MNLTETSLVDNIYYLPFFENGVFQSVYTYLLQIHEKTNYDGDLAKSKKFQLFFNSHDSIINRNMSIGQIE